MFIAPRRAFAHVALSAAAAALTAATAAAQAPINPSSFGVSAGAVIPTGTFGDAYNTGYSVDGIIALRVPTLPVSFRGEVGYARFGAKLSDNTNSRVISGVGNLVLGIPAGPTAVVRPYLIGGVGAYNGRRSEGVGNNTFNEASQTDVGLNGGIGIEIPLSGLTGFGEVRYTSIFTEGTHTNYVPIRFGIRF